jgi:hypothetical protein
LLDNAGVRTIPDTIRALVRRRSAAPTAWESPLWQTHPGPL